MSRKRFWKPFSADQAQRLDYRRAAWLRGRTEDRFARQVTCLDQLDSPVQEALQKTLRPGETILWMIYAPFQAYLRGRRLSSGWPLRSLPWEFSPDWVIALAEERLLLVQRTPEGQPAQLLSIPFESILSLQSGAVLLFSWFEIQWVEDGAAHRQVVYFNTVCTDLFARLCELIRCKLAGQNWSPAHPVEQNLAALDFLPYKFKNMIPLHALLSGERIREAWFRPALWKRRLVAFRTMTAPRLVAVLTDLHLILVEEDQTGAEGSYGLISTFLPLNRIERVTVEGQRLVIFAAVQNVTKKFSVECPVHKLEEAARLASACESHSCP